MIRLCAPQAWSCHAEAFAMDFLVGVHGAGLLIAVILASALAWVWANLLNN